MITNESWETRDGLLAAFNILQSIIDYYKSKFLMLELLKTTILDDAVKKADLKSLLDQDPINSMAGMVSLYQKAKANNDALVDIK